jgi:eukaryotic-like serine/threonine-protein kinase
MTLGHKGQSQLGRKICDQCGVLSDLSLDGNKVLTYNLLTEGTALRTALIDVASGARTAALARDSFDPRFSPDGRWVAFHISVDIPRRKMFIAPLRPGAPAPEHEWIPITDGSALDCFASWSPDGSVLYWISERDGFRCIVAQRLHSVTKRPVGTMFYIAHLHSARRSMITFPIRGCAALP